MPQEPQKVAADLAEIVTGDVLPDILHRAAFSTDASIYSIIPVCVVAPRNTADIVAVTQYAAARNIPLVARGAGSGVAGESLSTGIVLDMTRYMNRIVEVGDDGQTVTCQPGAVLDDVNKLLAGFDRTIGPDPSTGNRATIGGCVANNATGAHSLAYGYFADYVERIEAVLADGSIVEFHNNLDPAHTTDERLAEIAAGCRAVFSGKQTVIQSALPKTTRNRSGYNIGGICRNANIDMARLLAGSEGTLAIFAKIVLRTVPLPAARALLQLEFDSLDKAARAVPLIVESGAAACELMDQSLISMARNALSQYRDILPADAAAVLLVEHTASALPQAEQKIKKTSAAVADLASNRTIVLDPIQQQRLWKSRKDAVPLLYRNKGRKRPVPFIEDVSVHRDHLGQYISGMKQIAQRYQIPMSFYGHAGDGELHVRPYLDLADPDDVQKMCSIANDVFALAWSLGGSISGEHADGLVRAAFIKKQYGRAFYRLLCEIKNIFRL